MKNILAKLAPAGKVVLGLLSNLKRPSVATAAAGYLAPIIAGLFGDNFSVAVIAPYCVAVGGAAVAIEKALGQSKPTPPAPPAK